MDGFGEVVQAGPREVVVQLAKLFFLNPTSISRVFTGHHPLSVTARCLPNWLESPRVVEDA